jgi:hypothetical protein
MQRIASYLLFFLLLILVAVHLFFLNADAYSFFEIGRGAFTDEGWHTYQLRNWINGHGFDLLATDSFLKAPFFNLLLFPFFLLLGQQLWVGRMVIIIFSLSPFLFCLKRPRNTGFYFLLLALVFTHPLAFCYQHYLLPEMFAITAILSGILYLQKHFETERVQYLFFGMLCFILAFLLKAQFVYTLVLPLAYAFLYVLSAFEKASKIKVNVVVLSMLGIFLLLYFSLWYYPNKEGFEYYFSLLSHGQYTNPHDTWERAKYYYNEWLAFQPFWKSYVSVFWGAFLIGMVLFLFAKTSKFYRVVFFLSAVWVLLETHKFLAAYIPIRYLLPLIVAALLNVTIVFYELLRLAIRCFDNAIAKVTLLVVLLAMGLIFSKNLKWDYQIFQQREFALNSAKDYLKLHLEPDDKALGNWSPSLCIGLPNQVQTVSYAVNNWKTIYKTYKPTVVVSEENQVESDGVFRELKIDLVSESDSVKSFPIAYWKLNIYWIKQNNSNEKK